MPSRIWCARVGYPTELAPHEVAERIANVQKTEPKGFLYLDKVNEYGEVLIDAGQIILNARQVSAIEPWTPKIPDSRCLAPHEPHEVCQGCAGRRITSAPVYQP